MCLRPKKSQASESGKAMLELALLLPFFILLVMSSFEVYKTFQAHQYLSLVSREVGNDAIRSCTALATTALIQTCLNDVANRVVNESSEPGSPLRNVKVIVRLYRYPDPNPVTEGGRDNAAVVSRFTPTIVGTRLASFTADKGALITTEVFYSQPSFARSFSGNYYETTIF